MVPLRLPTILALFLATTALASSDSSLKKQLTPLLKRQSDAFIPDKTHGNGETCADAFGPGFYSCGTGIECVNPAQGDTCCSEGYGCPTNSFCLVKGYCCPDGLSPESCARANFVTLPADFTTAGVSLSNSTTPSTSVSLSAIASASQSTSPSTSASTSASPSTSASTSASPSTSVSVSIGTSPSSVAALVPTSVGTASAVATGSESTSTTQTATTTRPSVEVSTGAARAWRAVGFGEGVVGVWGMVGLVGMLGAVGGAM